jgi:hypothetical protein
MCVWKPPAQGATRRKFLVLVELTVTKLLWQAHFITFRDLLERKRKYLLMLHVKIWSFVWSVTCVRRYQATTISISVSSSPVFSLIASHFFVIRQNQHFIFFLWNQSESKKKSPTEKEIKDQHQGRNDTAGKSSLFGPKVACGEF